MKTDWRIIQCFGCGGHGVVSVYSWDDFEGAGWCRECGGGGYLFIRPSGHLFRYPGGPARGMAALKDYEHGEPYALGEVEHE